MQQTEIDTNALSALFEAEARQLAYYNIGFVVPESKDNTKDGRLGGSGSLVSIDGVEGVLTAEHVVHDLRRQESAGIILTGYRQGTVHECVFKPGDCPDFSYRAPVNHSAEGPDLSFFILPPDTTATLKAKQSFYNLSKRREAMLDKPPSHELGLWVIYGMAGEWTKDAPDPMGFERIKVFQGKLLGALESIGRRTSDGFDYIDFEVVYHDGYEGPQSFGGYSGGGIWQLIIKPAAGVPKVIKRHLMGVAFYQSEKTERDEQNIRKITCHGRESVYGSLIDRVRERMS